MQPHLRITTYLGLAPSFLLIVNILICYFKGKSFLIFCDAFSKWLHVQYMTNTTTDTVTKALSEIFAIWGYPHKLVSDNGLPLQSIEFKNFCTRCNIVHCPTPARHPESNGFAERAVQLAKKALNKISLDLEKKETQDEFSFSVQFYSFLFNYRNTPSTVTGKSPNELLLSFRPRTNLSILNRKFQTPSGTSNFSMFREGDRVTVRISNASLVEGIVVRQLGIGSPPVSYTHLTLPTKRIV